MAEYKVYEAVKPVGQCRVCGNLFFPHTTKCALPHAHGDTDCPLNGEEWREYQQSLWTARLYRGM